jgi:hypothetical protein
MFSGGSYEEVERWLRNFVTSHAKREHPRAEIVMDASGDREGKSYGVHVRVGPRVSPLVEFDYREVADSRGSLAWCAKMAERVRGLVRTLLAERTAADAPTR